MSWQRSIQAASRALRKEETSLRKELGLIQKRIHDLDELAKEQSPNGKSARPKSGAQRLSPKGRAAISRAAKRRWAEYRRDKRREQRAG